MHTTNYTNTLITVSPDTRAVAATVPPMGKASIAEMQFVLAHSHDYELTSDELIFTVFAQRKGVVAVDLPDAREQFFSKGQPCLRTSPLAKNYGWGIHADAVGRVALIPMGTSAYDDLVNDEATTTRPAMKAGR